MGSFKVVKQLGQDLIVEKKSKFYAFAYPVKQVDEAILIVSNIKKKYFDARHHCFAYVIGYKENLQTRFFDDKEPTNTAGVPLLNIILGNNLTNTLLVVVRYFGGILLGTGGLIKAYTLAGQMALKNAKIGKMILTKNVMLDISYKDESNIRRICKNLMQSNKYINIKEIDYTNSCKMMIEVEDDCLLKFLSTIKEYFNNAYNPTIVGDGYIYE